MLYAHQHYLNLLAALMMVFLCLSAMAETPVRPVIKIGFSDLESYPNEYIENEQLVGFHIEMITKVANQLGYDIQPVQMPMKRLLKMNKRGTLDGVVYGHGAAFDNDFLHFYKGSTDYGNELTVNSYFLMINKDRKDIRFRGDYASIKQLDIGIIRGFNLISFGDFENIFEGLNVFEADSQKQLQKLLKRGRIDAAIVPLTYFHRYKNGNLDGFKVLSRPLIVDYSYLAFSKQNISMDFVINFSDELVNYQNSTDYLRRLKHYNKLRGLPREGE